MVDTPYIRRYEGTTWAQAFEAFRSDWSLASFDGWHPGSTSWEDGELRVVYARGKPIRKETHSRGVAWELAWLTARVLAPALPWLMVAAATVVLTFLVVGPGIDYLTR